MKSIIKVVSQAVALSSLAVSMVLSSQTLANEVISQSLPANEVTNISIDSHSGSIKVIGWNQNNVKVEGQLDDDADALIFEQRGAQILIKVDYGNMNRWGSDDTELVVHAPKSVRINIAGVSTDIDLEQLDGGVEGKTVSGDIRAKALTQHIELSSISGSVKSSHLSGKISLSVVSGDIDDSSSTGRLQLQSVSGDIDLLSSASEVFINNVSGNSKLKLTDTMELRVSTVSGDIESYVELKNKGLVKASSVSGDLGFYFQPNIDASFRLKSNVSGDLINKLTNDKAQESQYGLGAKLNFQTGNGQASFSATSVSGNIKIAHQ